MTGNNCLKVLFTKGEYKERLFTNDLPIAEYIRTKTGYWFGYNEEGYGIQGFYNWDVTAAVYLMHPELFEENPVRQDITEENLKTGYLRASVEGTAICNLPKIVEEKAFKNQIYQTWMKVSI